MNLIIFKPSKFFKTSKFGVRITLSVRSSVRIRFRLKFRLKFRVRAKGRLRRWKSYGLKLWVQKFLKPSDLKFKEFKIRFSKFQDLKFGLKNESKTLKWEIIITVGGPLFCNFRTRKSYKIRGTLQNKGPVPLILYKIRGTYYAFRISIWKRIKRVRKSITRFFVLF